MVWTEGKDSLKEFLKHCNRQNKHIQFTESEVGTTVPFLDVSVSLQNEKLHTVVVVVYLFTYVTFINTGILITGNEVTKYS